jgi:homoserine dehydrogenase
LAANRIQRVAGILNGTCNYILTVMREQKREFAEVLAEAQKLGYAEADPSFDIDGIDSAAYDCDWNSKLHFLNDQVPPGNYKTRK